MALLWFTVYVAWRRNGKVSVDLRSRGRTGFDSPSGRYQVVTACMSDCLRTGKPAGYITNN